MLGAGPAPQLRVDEFRREVISRIAAWSIDHPGEKLDFAQVFPQHFQKLRDAYFDEKKKVLKKTHEDLVRFVTDGPSGSGLDTEARARVETTLETLRTRFGYCPDCAREATALLLRKRYG
jgi:hypothetical protein